MVTHVRMMGEVHKHALNSIMNECLRQLGSGRLYASRVKHHSIVILLKNLWRWQLMAKSAGAPCNVCAAASRITPRQCACHTSCMQAQPLPAHAQAHELVRKHAATASAAVS